MSQESILKEFSLFSLGGDGIGGWLGEHTDVRVFERLASIETDPLSKVQLNQLLSFGHEAPVSDGFFKYYWLSSPDFHPYEVNKIPDYNLDWREAHTIVSLDHLKWGLYRLFTDGLLWFGNVRTAYRMLRSMSESELKQFFSERRFETELIKERGPALPLVTIPKDDRYLISEMACKSYGEGASSASALKLALLESMDTHLSSGGGAITIKQLLSGDHAKSHYGPQQQEFLFSADDVLEESVSSCEELEERYSRIAIKFEKARNAALENTKLYLSMVNDLDVYVATSMRTRQDFRGMASDCDTIFLDDKLNALNLRYFDPTLSVASGHEDKGLIECLMVKCAKALVYCAGERESYGKDAEAAMALSLGKPVIFYCNQEQRSRFYREVHPLSRLIGV